MSLGVQTYRVFSGFERIEYSSGTVCGGGGLTTPGRQTTVARTNGQYVANGTIGYKTYEHTFFASWSRTFADTYGLGATSVMIGPGGWTSARPGRSWRTGASFSEQRLLGTAFATLDAWQADVSFQRALGQHTAMRAEYAYMRLSGGPMLLSAISPSAVRLSLTWSPESCLSPR